MIFNTFSYFILFLIPAAVLFRICSAEIRPWICAFFGIAFYIFFSFTEFGGWYSAATILILLWESFFRNFYNPKSRYCIIGIGIAVCVLGVFKYWNFFTDLFFSFSSTNPLHWKGIFLPIGISFFTFEFIHYAADRYQNKTEKGKFKEYLAFIFFFPTMVAGPIKRFQDFLPCLRSPSKNWLADWNRGITRILAGLLKKFAVADLLTSLTNNLNHDSIAIADREILILWLFAYGWKIYFDFSAYSDIAIGSSRLFGIKIPENFDWPYLCTNITEFWRHWHISLNKWLVDYVFRPLGGSRGNKLFVCKNIMIVMLVSGLWHGAGLNFVIWGAWHGFLLASHRLWKDSILAKKIDQKLPYCNIFYWLLTYTLVNFGWAFFAMDINTATFFLKRVFWG